MTINWKVRIKNPVFWRNIIIAVVATILAQLGMDWAQITSWGAFFGLLRQAVQNPVIVVAVVGVIWNAVNDPTTAGNSDSAQAMTYLTPKKTD